MEITASVATAPVIVNSVTTAKIAHTRNARGHATTTESVWTESVSVIGDGWDPDVTCVDVHRDAMTTLTVMMVNVHVTRVSVEKTAILEHAPTIVTLMDIVSTDLVIVVMDGQVMTVQKRFVPMAVPKGASVLTAPVSATLASLAVIVHW